MFDNIVYNESFNSVNIPIQIPTSTVNTDPIFSWPPIKNFPNFKDNLKKSWPLYQNNDIMDTSEDSILPENIYEMEIEYNSDDNCIFDISNWTTNDSISRNKYRDKIHSKFNRKCIISRTDAIECECSHIVPRNICDKFNLKFKYHCANGLLLNRNLHSTFDLYLWTFDIFDLKKDNNSNDYIYLSIIIHPNRKNYTVNQYQYENNNNLKYYKIPLKSLPYLYAHYTIFLERNYRNNKSSEDILYKAILQDTLFKQLLFNPNSIYDYLQEVQKEKLHPYLILKQSYDQQSIPIYFVLWKYWPFSAASWEYKYKINPKLIQDFINYSEQIKDPNY